MIVFESLGFYSVYVILEKDVDLHHLIQYLWNHFVVHALKADNEFGSGLVGLLLYFMESSRTKYDIVIFNFSYGANSLLLRVPRVYEENNILMYR